MKRFILTLSLFAVASAATYAQSAAPQVSKAEFTTKVSELNTLLNANSTEAAKAKWEELHKMMGTELSIMRTRYRQADAAHNEVDKAHYGPMMTAQRKMYAETLQLSKDMAANKVYLHDKLVAFTGTIL